MNESEKIARKLEYLKTYVGRLKEKQHITKKQLSESYDLRAVIERNFQIALESVIEIGEMLISMRCLRKPEKHTEVILILGEGGVLPKEFAEKFAPAAGFRNILVHHYTEVDLNKMYRFLQDGLKDFDIFARHVARFLKKKKGKLTL